MEVSKRRPREFIGDGGPMKRRRMSSNDLLGQLKAQVRNEVEAEMREEAGNALIMAKTFEHEWLHKMAKRTVVSIGADGEEVISQQAIEGSLHESYIAVAQAIIRRSEPDNVLVKNCYAVANPISTMEHEDLMDPSGQKFYTLWITVQNQVLYLEYELAATLCHEIDIQSRNEVYRYVVRHPFYTHSEPAKRRNIRKEIIKFFDKLFTDHVSKLVVGHLLSRDTETLSLGADEFLTEKDGLPHKHTESGLLYENRRKWLALFPSTTSNY